MAAEGVWPDRGPGDEHWMHAFGQICAKCDSLMEEGDFVRRRGTGDWVHERCVPRPLIDDDGDPVSLLS
ncbi:MAG TPA: hypothetical protein VH274_06830 [Mycobacteriales bacterium]|nr:hypothetical protein [Mycobacteriales bacterium]